MSSAVLWRNFFWQTADVNWDRVSYKCQARVNGCPRVLAILVNHAALPHSNGNATACSLAPRSANPCCSDIAFVWFSRNSTFVAQTNRILSSYTGNPPALGPTRPGMCITKNMRSANSAVRKSSNAPFSLFHYSKYVMVQKVVKMG